MSIDRRRFPARTRSPAGPPLLAVLATGAAALCAVPLVYLTIRVLAGGGGTRRIDFEIGMSANYVI